MRDRQTISCNHIEGVIKDFSDKAFCVLSHCDTDKKMNQLDIMLNHIRDKFDLPIFLFSHLYLPKNVVDKVDYFLYNSNNPIYNLDLITPINYALTYGIRYDLNYVVRRKMFYHSYAHYLQMFDAITLLNNQKINFGYLLNYDVPLTILNQITEYQSILEDNFEVVHFNYQEDNSMSTEVFFCKVNSVYEKIKDKLSIQKFETTSGQSLETIFKILLSGLNFYNLGNFGNTEGKSYIGSNNFDFYEKNKVTILHSNINDLLIIPHSFHEETRVISLRNCPSPRSKSKNIKFIFYDENFVELENVEKEIVVHSSCHFGVKKEYRYTKLFIDDSHEIIFDLNDENNYGFLEKRKINANIRL